MTEREYQRVLNRSAEKFFPKSLKLPMGRVEAMKRSKQFLKIKEQRIRQRHRAGLGGAEVSRMRSDMIDLLVRKLWEEMMAGLSEKARSKVKVSVVAHGGYGRRVMSPCSDIDFTFLLPGNGGQVDATVAEVIGDFLLYFYDLRFKVGMGTRSVGETIALANEDVETKTAVMEARFLTGDPGPFEEFKKRFDKECMRGNETAFLKLRQNDLKSRHAKYGRTPFVQEPHVKNGCGGLRDYQNLIWMSYAKFRTLNPKDLLEREIVTPTGWREIEKAYNFILRVRNEMHYTDPKSGDILTLRLQGQVAANLGYRHRTVLRKIEAFMRDYYTATRDLLQRSSEIMDQFFLDDLEQQRNKTTPLSFLIRKRRPKEERFDGFLAKDNRVYDEHPERTREDPARLMRLFLHTQRRHLRLSPQAFHEAQDNFRVINRRYLYNTEVRRIFFEIIGQKGDAARTLRQMHRVGFLGRYMPEFGALTCLVQHEFFHRYTADEHTLRTLDYLDELSGAEKPGLGLYQKLYHELRQPVILVLALLLHDAGRAENKETHADESTVLAAQVSRRFVIKGEARRLLLFLVDNHLLMYRIATSRNLEDPSVIEEFVTVVRNREYLDTLLVMTYADSKGTSEQSWSGYKESSILQLYRQAARRLEAPGEFEREFSAPPDDLRREVRKKLGAGFEAECDAHFTKMPRNYFVLRDAESIVSHIRQFHQFFVQLSDDKTESALNPLMQWTDHAGQGHTELTVACWDRHLLLARVAGALAADNINILSADLFRRDDDLVLDLFRVCSQKLGPVTSKSARKRIENRVFQSFKELKFDFSDAITQRRKSEAKFEEVAEEIPQRVHVSNDHSSEHTVIELQVIDRLGLLYDVFAAIGSMDLSISHARISTEKGMAIDSIYVQTQADRPIEDPEMLIELEELICFRLFGQDRSGTAVKSFKPRKIQPKAKPTTPSRSTLR
jgi:[protein-PII] uridylyltransferase